jgi:hypothetical protein
MRNRLMYAVAGGALVAAGIAGVAVAGGSDRAPAGGGAQDTVVHQLSADYPSFASLDRLTAAAPVVVRATAVEVGATYHDRSAPMPADKMPAHKVEQLGPTQHDVTFRIDRTLRGTAVAGTTLRVVELGGRIGKDVYVAADEPSSVQGRSYVLFLTPLAGGKHGIVGGPQGRYQVEADRLSALGAEVRSAGAGRELHGRTVADVEQAVRRVR